MLESLITSKTRIRLLLKFFLNPETRAYLRELAQEFDESSNGIRVELNRLADARLLQSESVGRTVVYRANAKHPLFGDLQSLMKKYIGVDRVVEDLVNQLGEVKAAYITGDYARGIDSGIIDLILIGQVNRTMLDKAVTKTSQLIKRKIRPLVLTAAELDALKDKLDIKHALPIWSDNQAVGAGTLHTNTGS